MDLIQQRANKERNLLEAQAKFKQAFDELNMRIEQCLSPDTPEVTADPSLRQRVIHIEKDANAILATAPSIDGIYGVQTLTIFEDIDGEPHPLFVQLTSDEELKKNSEDSHIDIGVERYFSGAILTGPIVSGEVIYVGPKLTRQERIALATQLGEANLHDFTDQSDEFIDERLDHLNIPSWSTVRK